MRRYIELISANAAKIYGLDHCKGRIAIGLDADLALWDPARQWSIGHEHLHSRVDFSPYQGRKVTGKPTTVLMRGMPVILDEVLMGHPGFGRILPRRASHPVLARLPIEERMPWLEP